MAIAIFYYEEEGCALHSPAVAGGDMEDQDEQGTKSELNQKKGDVQMMIKANGA